MEENHSVWVGLLSSSTKEEMLSDLFGKLGPVKSVVIMRDEQGRSKQFGYVNFYNSEVAECAAHAMDGCTVSGQTIKTKGPKELQSLKAEQNTGKKDYRIFTDCLFFIDKRECTWKPGECPFRHCSKAKLTRKVCEKWLERQCEDLNCGNRHPRLNKNGSWINNKGGNRCPSHNAFKCFGECGSTDCNTHFLEKTAYLDHVQMVGKKSTSPVATCPKCQAVFYNAAKKLEHHCYKTAEATFQAIQNFTSTRLQAEKDMAYPVPTYPTKSLDIPENVDQNSGNFPMSPRNSFKVTADNGRKTQENHACKQINNKVPDSVFKREQPCDGPHKSDICCRDACTGSPYSSLRPQRKDVEPIGVFWDFENCPIPKGKSPLAIVRKLRNVFFKEKREVEFMCVCDISKEKKCIIEELNKAQVTVVHINSTSKNAADDKLRQSLRRFAQTYCRPATVILISGDGNFAVELSDLRHRHNFQIICLHNVSASAALLGFAHETHRFDLFAEDLATFTPNQETSKPLVDVLITNLPQFKSIVHLRSKLTKLSDNCGGKVISISGNKAVIRFPNAEAASRARRRLDKEELFGYILQASLLPLRGHKESVTNDRGYCENSPVLGNPLSPQTPPMSTRALTEVNLNTSSSRLLQTPENEMINTVRPNSEKRQYHERFQHSNNFQYFQTPNFNKQIQVYHPYTNMFHPSLVHTNMFHHLSQSPSPLHNTGIFPPSCTFNPVVNNTVSRSPSPDQIVGGVDLLVTNLNEMYSKKDIKKKLASVFREHSKVYSVVLHARRGAPLRALVKVPKMLDAHVVISKLNGKVVHDKVVHVSIALDKDKQLCYLQNEVNEILQEVPLNWLPLSTFLSNYEKKYRKSFDVRLLDQLRDSIVVDGSTGCQTVTLLQSKADAEPVQVDATSFPLDVFKLLHHYEGVIPLSSFPALYWLEFHKEICPSSSGKLLVDLLSTIPNVMVTGTTPTGTARSLQWIKPFNSHCDAFSFLQLSTKLVDIFQKQHLFEMSVGQLQDHFLSLYGKPLQSFSYGFQSVEDLLYTFPTVIQLDKTNSTESSVSLTQPERITLFAKQIEELLGQYQDNTVLLSNFMASYVKYFGQKFKVASFGFNRLSELIKIMPDVAEIEGTGEQRTVTLVKKYKMRPSLVSLDKLTEEMTALLNDNEAHEICLNDIMRTFCQKHGRRVTSEPRETLEQLLERLPGFQIVEKGEKKFLQFLTRNTDEQIKDCIIPLLKQQENKFLFVKNIPKSYEKLYLKALPCKMESVKEVLPHMNEHFQILGNGNDQIIKLFDDEETEIDMEFVSVKTAVEILSSYPGYTSPKSNFVSLYRQKLLQRYRINIQDEQLLDSLPICVMTRKQGEQKIVSLKLEYRRQILIEHLKEIISSSPDMSLSLDELQQRYRDRFTVNLDLSSYGFNNMFELKKQLQGFIEICFSNDEQTSGQATLSPLSRFEVETRALLNHSAGSLPLNRFAPAYQQFFSKACVVANFGYNKLIPLLTAVPHVAKIVGNGPEKVVIAIDVSIPERICTDLLSVRILDEEDNLPNKGKEKPSSNLDEASTKLFSELENSSVSTFNDDGHLNATQPNQNPKGKTRLPSNSHVTDFPSSHLVTLQCDVERLSPSRRNRTVQNNSGANCTNSPSTSTQKIRLAAKFNFSLNS